jgi:leucyl aminopeptidase
LPSWEGGGEMMAAGKRAVTALAACLAAFLFCAPLLGQASAADGRDVRQVPYGSTDTLITEMLGKVSANSIYSTDYDLQNFTSRHIYTESCFNASIYIHDQFAKNPSLSVSYDSFKYGSIDVRNVIAVLPGKSNPGSVQYVIGAHYDSTNSGGYDYAPGADDDASGVAVVIEAARILSQYSFERTIVFAAFTAEEEGVVGSSHYAKNASDHGVNIGGMLEFDMVGYDPDSKNIITVDNYDDSVDIYNNLTSLNSAYSIGFTIHETTGGGRSDHEAFDNYGYPAALCIEDNDHLNPGYHSDADTIDHVNMNFEAKFARLGIAAIADMAGVISSSVQELPQAIMPLTAVIATFIVAVGICTGRMKNRRS